MTFRKTFVKDYLSVMHSEGQNPLGLWSRHKGTQGFIRRVWDDELKTFALDIRAPNISTCCITTARRLGVSLPYLTLLVKNMNKYFAFEVMILDDLQTRRRLRFSNFQSRIVVSTFDLAMPLCLNIKDPWNMIRFDLSRVVLQAFGTVYRETVEISVKANCRLKRIYFSKTLVPEHLLPHEYTLKPRYRTKTGRLQAAQDETPSLHTPPPSIVTRPSLLFHDDFEYEGEEMSPESSPRLYPAVDTLPLFFSPQESELEAEEDGATFIVSPKNKTMGTQTMLDDFPSERLSHIEEPCEEFAEEASLHYEFSNLSLGAQESSDEILLSYAP